MHGDLDHVIMSGHGSSLAYTQTTLGIRDPTTVRRRKMHEKQRGQLSKLKSALAYNLLAHKLARPSTFCLACSHQGHIAFDWHHDERLPGAHQAVKARANCCGTRLDI